MSLIKTVAQQARRTNVVASKSSASSSAHPLGGYNENKAQLRRETTAQYYRDHDIHNAAKKDSVRLKAAALLFTGRIPSDIDLIVTFFVFVKMPNGRILFSDRRSIYSQSCLYAWHTELKASDPCHSLSSQIRTFSKLWNSTFVPSR
jgi:hypothetical protein